MTIVAVGGATYHLVAAMESGRWRARAERQESGERYGIECTGASEQEALTRLARWLQWQYEHRAALEALQRAESAYYRTIAGSAFASPVEGASALELQKESLAALEAARTHLDEIRSQNPEA